MKIALLNPPWCDERCPELWGVRAGSRWPHFQKRVAAGELPRYIPFPFFLSIAASALQKAGHDVLLIDGVAEGIGLDIFCERVTAFGPEIIFSETSTPSLDTDSRILRKLYELNKDAVLVCGGTHPASLAAEFLKKEGFVKYWITGEYEESLSRLVVALEGNKDPVGIPGVIWKNELPEEIASIKDLNKLPAPLFEQLPVKNYSDPVCGLPSPTAQTWLSRGCPFGCTFCVWPQVVYGNREYRTRGIDNALNEVSLLIDKYGCESFYFDDDTTNIGEGRMKELAEKIKNRGLDKFPWSMMARADCMSDSMIDVLADAGMYSVKYGVESISPGLINVCGKGTNVEKLKRAIEYTKSVGVKVHLTFTFGLPGETRDTIKETLNFCMDVEPETAQFSLCTPFPGTMFYEECKENGWLITEDWGQYLGSGGAVVETPWLSAEELSEGYREALESWDLFVSNRLNKRKELLIKKVKSLVASGKRWALFGDPDFASFLTESSDLEKPVSSFGESDCVPVIVSRHDEEKIWRQLKRKDSVAAESALRLY